MTPRVRTTTSTNTTRTCGPSPSTRSVIRGKALSEQSPVQKGPFVLRSQSMRLVQMHVQMQNQNPSVSHLRKGSPAMAVGEIARAAIRPPELRTRVEPDGPAWLELGPDDRAARFMRLISDLSRGHDEVGDGKRMPGGHVYSGGGAAVGWTSVCGHQRWGAPGEGGGSSARRWQGVRAGLPESLCHYVSLGPGDGRKDGVLLEDLSQANADLC